MVPVLAMQILGKREDALDAVHNAITSTLTRPETYQTEKGPLKPWFLRVVRNRCIDLLRQIRTNEASVEALQDNTANPEQTLAQGTVMSRLHRSRLALKEKLAGTNYGN